MPKGSAELTNARREEILAACRKLYETRSFKEITLKEIGQQTSFTRTSIYNYFETKEEIFLALFQREYELFAAELDALCAREEPLGLEAFSSELVEVKAAYGGAKDALDRCLRRFCPALDESGRQHFLYAFLPFVYGLYPYTVVTDKQREAMREAGIGYVYMSTYEMARDFIRTMLGGLS